MRYRLKVAGILLLVTTLNVEYAFAQTYLDAVEEVFIDRFVVPLLNGEAVRVEGLEEHPRVPGLDYYYDPTAKIGVDFQFANLSETKSAVIYAPLLSDGDAALDPSWEVGLLSQSAIEVKNYIQMWSKSHGGEDRTQCLFELYEQGDLANRPIDLYAATFRVAVNSSAMLFFRQNRADRTLPASVQVYIVVADELPCVAVNGS